MLPQASRAAFLSLLVENRRMPPLRWEGHRGKKMPYRCDFSDSVRIERMDPKGLSLVASLPLLFCPVSNPSASLTALHVVPQPSRLPDETPEPAHPPHGEGSGELLVFNGLSASGAISNVQANIVYSSWEPPNRGHSKLDLFTKPVPLMLKVATVRPPTSPAAPRPPVLLTSRGSFYEAFEGTAGIA